LHFGVNQVNGDLCFTLYALESGGFHFGVDLRTSNDNSSERDQPVDVLFLETAHDIDFAKVLN
jgi:hypothetical protein